MTTLDYNDLLRANSCKLKEISDALRKNNPHMNQLDITEKIIAESGENTDLKGAIDRHHQKMMNTGEINSSVCKGSAPLLG